MAQPGSSHGSPAYKEFTQLIEELVKRNEETVRLTTQNFTLTEEGQFQADVDTICKAISLQFDVLGELRTEEVWKYMNFLVAYLQYLEDCVDEETLEWALYKHISGSIRARKAFGQPENSENVNTIIEKILSQFKDTRKFEIVTSFILLLAPDNAPTEFCLKPQGASRDAVMCKIETSEDRTAFLECLLQIIMSKQVFVPFFISPSESCPQLGKDTLLALISIPWIIDDHNIEWNRYARGNEVLQNLKNIIQGSQTVAARKDLESKSLTLWAIAGLQHKDEWRKSIFEAALSDRELYKPALECVHVLIQNISSVSGKSLVTSLIRHALQLKTTEGHREALSCSLYLRALKQTICALDPTSVVSPNRVICKVCCSSGTPTSNTKPEFNGEFIEMLRKSTEDEVAICVKTEVSHIIFTILKHKYDVNKENIRRLLCSSFQLLRTVDSDLFDLYTLSLSEIVSLEEVSLQEENQLREVMNTLQFGPMHTAMYVCALKSRDKLFAESCFISHVVLAALKKLDAMVVNSKNLALKVAESENISTRSLFLRKAPTICAELINGFMDRLIGNQSFGESQDSGNRDRSIDRSINIFSHIFGYSSVRKFLRAANNQLCSQLFTCPSHCQEEATIILTRIASILNIEREALVESCFPTILGRLIKKEADLKSSPKLSQRNDINSINEKNAVEQFISTFCGYKMGYFIKMRLNACIDQMLYSLCVDEKFCKAELKKMAYMRGVKMEVYSMTKHLRNIFLGILLKFRMVFVSDEYYTMRSTLARSFSRIIQLLDRDFVEKNALRMVAVLRAATGVGDPLIPAWEAFVGCLTPSSLVQILPHVFISAGPILHHERAQQMLYGIGATLEGSQLTPGEEAKIERLAVVMMDNGPVETHKYLPGAIKIRPTNSMVIDYCMRALQEDGVEVAELVLTKLLKVIPREKLEDNVSAELLGALLYTIKANPSHAVHSLVCQCLGLLGAVDPGRIADYVPTWKTQKSIEVLFNPKESQYFAHLLNNCARLHLECADATKLDCISYGVQELLKEFHQRSRFDYAEIEKLMSPEYVKEIDPLKSTCFLHSTLPAPTLERPIVGAAHVNSYPEWLAQWYMICVQQVIDEDLKILFGHLKYIVRTGVGSTSFGLYVMCTAMVQLLIEGTEAIVKDCVLEMTTVLRRSYEGEQGWLKQAAHVVFAVVDTAERYLIYRGKEVLAKGHKPDSDAIHKRVTEFIKSVMEVKVANDSLAVLVAQACHCPARALKWLEKYCVEKDSQGLNHPTREQFFRLEKIYSEMDFTDGVLGAYESIDIKWETSPEETIVAFEANGDYNEALSFYKSRNLSVPLMKSLLRLNKPELAWTLLKENNFNAEDVSVLKSYQMEAAWRLSKWSDLDALAGTSDSDPSAVWTWGASTASIFEAIRSSDKGKMETRIKNARDRLVSSMTAMTMVDADTYTQCYKYISQLSILTEIEGAVESLELLKSSKDYMINESKLNKVLNAWKDRSELMTNVASIQEPVFSARRSILDHSNVSPRLTSPAICNLLLQSSRLARQTGQSQVAWTFLVEAKNMRTSQIDVAIEESRYTFDKGDTSKAVTILQNAVGRLLPSAAKAFEMCATSSSSQWEEIVRTGTNKEELATFVKTKVLLCEYIQRGGETSLDDQYNTYVFISRFSQRNEDLSYRVAVFLDNYVYSRNEELAVNQINEVLNAYGQVLEYGDNHLFHAMPRLLTIWLDMTQNVVTTQCQKTLRAVKKYVDPTEFNRIVHGLFRKIRPFAFYTAFAQMISRILHPSDSVFEVLKDIISDLIVKYPHQCLWRSIAVYRCRPEDCTPKSKHERCDKIYQLAMRKDRSLQNHIVHYNYIAKELTKVCESTNFAKGQTKSYFKQTSFAYIHEFFRTGYMHDVEKSNQLNIKPLLLLPFSDLLEKEMETPVHSLTQLPNGPAMTHQEFPSIYIDSIVDEFDIINSIARPKKCTLRGSDGKLYPILCKPMDELRKDSRIIDIERMVNSLLMQNPDARRKQLSIRTYSVTPLQDKGGLIEWVPNLMPLRRLMLPFYDAGVDSNTKRALDHEIVRLLRPELSKDKRLEGFQKLLETYPAVLSEWFRIQFAQPSKWYTARTAFTTTSAVMSMLGFVMGLGDRHAENILVDMTTGQIMHVDYNMLFNKSEDLRVPEIVPFRLTRNVVDAFGPTGVEGVFRKSCETTMTVLRQKKDMLLTVLQAFGHDPLLEWSLDRSQQIRQNANKIQNQENVNKKPADDAIGMVEDRLIGKIVSPKVFKSTLANVPMSVPGQVAKLIALSVDQRRLSQMYVGWAPYL
ncbi:hypothetical protein L596_018721 [Steinernema carpocapsae]|uniref:Serine/threonine-protein kinase ATR n=1 Tax=Steinernema carpocapsae TaxID=34508 RepID=A0A4U5N6B1_STECR|nr:hypothetical protein L596_018721 [Steinernema carpocapsae]